MDHDLGLESAQYSVILVVFFGKAIQLNPIWCLDIYWIFSDMIGIVGYVVFEPPSNMILVRTRPSIYLPILMTCWVSYGSS